MVNELVELKRNRVDLSGVEGLSDDMKEIVLACHDDEFFSKEMYSNFGDVANAIDALVKRFL